MAVTEGVDVETQAAVDAILGLAPAGESDSELYDHAVAVAVGDDLYSMRKRRLRSMRNWALRPLAIRMPSFTIMPSPSSPAIADARQAISSGGLPSATTRPPASSR